MEKITQYVYAMNIFLVDQLREEGNEIETGFGRRFLRHTQPHQSTSEYPFHHRAGASELLAQPYTAFTVP